MASSLCLLHSQIAFLASSSQRTQRIYLLQRLNTDFVHDLTDNASSIEPTSLANGPNRTHGHSRDCSRAFFLLIQAGRQSIIGGTGV